MKKFGICLAFVLMLALLLTGCNDTPEQPSNDAHATDAPATDKNDPPATDTVEIPSLEELIEINDLNKVFEKHSNLYVNVEVKYAADGEERKQDVIYVKDENGLCYHKRIRSASDEEYTYTSFVGNTIYDTYKDRNTAILNVDSSGYFDYTVDFESTPVGKGYIENDRIVYHSYYIYEESEAFDAGREDYTLYFNKDTKLLERKDYVSYNADHTVDHEYTSTITYDVENVEEKFETNAYKNIMSREDLIDVEVIANFGTPEQKSYSFVAPANASVWGYLEQVAYYFYADPEYMNEVNDLTAYAGEKKITLYAKAWEATMIPSIDPIEVPTFEELLEINSLENIVASHKNLHVNIESKSDTGVYSFDEEVIYIMDDNGFSVHKLLKNAFNGGDSYVSFMKNAYYGIDEMGIYSMLDDSMDPYSDHTLDFASTPIGIGYIENDQIIYHTYYIVDGSDMFAASRSDITLYFNMETRFIERMEYVTYNADHKVEIEYSLTVSYDVDDIEEKYFTTAYDTVVNSENAITLEIIANAGTAEEKAFSFVTTTDSDVNVFIGSELYGLYSDSACQNAVESLEAYKGEKSLTLYAKKP